MNEFKLAIVKHWPNESAIDLTGQNGEVDAPVYEMLGHLYRINPVNNYALYWSKKRKWEENGRYTNAAVRLNGTLQK